MKVRTPAIRLGLLPAGIAIALTPAFASAQDAAKGTTDLDRIEVTGSRIRQASMETAQPVIALQRADIEKQGFTSVADIVQNLAATGSPAISSTRASSDASMRTPSRSAALPRIAMLRTGTSTSPSFT